LFSYGADLFLITIGTQLIISSQTVLISRQLGLDAAALWSVMTKVFSLVSQVLGKMIGNAMPAFAEMYVRKENDRLWSRYRTMFITLSVLSGVCGVLFAACNGPFVSVWMHGQFSWPAVDNMLLALWLVASTQQSCHNGLIMNLKQIRGLKYVYLLEGVLFVGLAIVILPSTGMTGMLICSVVATTLFTWLCGVWRVAGLSGKGWKPLVWDWQLPLFWVVGVMVPCWLAIEWTLRDAPDWLRLVINGGLLTVIGVFVSLRFALPSDLATEIVGKLPPAAQRIAVILRRRG
jgi:O-antigen/teichoic acid export membrane protein